MRTRVIKGILAAFCVLLFAACSSPDASVVSQQAATPLPPTETVAPPTTTAEPTTEPTATSTPTPTVEPTVEPTLEPTPEPTPEPTATTALDTSLPDDWVAFTDETKGLVIYYPSQWEVAQPNAESLGSLIDQAKDGVSSAAIETILGQLLNTPGALDLFVALGFLFDDPSIEDNQFVSNFTAIVAPSEGLTLDTYVKMVSTQLGSIESFEIQDGQIESNLRPGGVDVASLRYTSDGELLYGLPTGTQIDGWQVATFDTKAERLLILSLTGEHENFPALEEMFRILIANLQFE